MKSFQPTEIQRFTQQPLLSKPDHHLVTLLLKHDVTKTVLLEPMSFQPDKPHPFNISVGNYFYRYFPKVAQAARTMTEPFRKIDRLYHRLFPSAHIRVEKWLIRPGDFITAGNTPLFSFRYTKFFGWWSCRDIHLYKADTSGIFGHQFVDDHLTTSAGKKIYSIIPLEIFEAAKGNMNPGEPANQLRYGDIASIAFTLIERLSGTTFRSDDDTGALMILRDTIDGYGTSSSTSGSISPIPPPSSPASQPEELARRLSAVEQDETLSPTAKQLLIAQILIEFDNLAERRRK